LIFNNVARATARDGLIVGNAFDYATGLLFYNLDADPVAGGLVEDVEVAGTMGTCFQLYPGRDVTFRRTRCRDPRCDGDGLFQGWNAHSDSTGNRIEDSTYEGGTCLDPVASDPGFDLVEVTETSQAPREPLALELCWE
jgi:hypothetical protein